jgi:hypothetical protein
MWSDRIGPFAFYNWFKDEWLVSRRAANFFFLASLFVLGTIPIFLGKVGTSKPSFWINLAWGTEGVFGPLSIFFVWIGMWRYWIRLDNSSKSEKRISFYLLLFGMFYGSVIYYFFVYRSQVMDGSWAKPPIFSKRLRNARPGWGRERLFFVGILSIFAFLLLFGLLLPIVLGHLPPTLSSSNLDIFQGLGLSAGVVSFFVFLVAMLFRPATETHEGNDEHFAWSMKKAIFSGLGCVLIFAALFAGLIPHILKKILPPQYEDDYEIFLVLGLAVGGVISFVFLIVKLFCAGIKSDEDESIRPRGRLQRTFLIRFLLFLGFILVFGLMANVLLGIFFPKFVQDYSVFVALAMIAGIVSSGVYLIVGVYRLGMKPRR